MANTCGFGKIKDGRFNSICIKGKDIIDCDRNLKHIKEAKIQNLSVRQNLSVTNDANIFGNVNVAELLEDVYVFPSIQV